MNRETGDRRDFGNADGYSGSDADLCRELSQRLSRTRECDGNSSDGQESDRSASGDEEKKRRDFLDWRSEIHLLYDKGDVGNLDGAVEEIKI